MFKKAASVSAFLWVIGLALVAILGLFGWAVFFKEPMPAKIELGGGGSGDGGGLIATTGCPDTKLTTPMVRLEDTGASSLTYAASSRCHVIDTTTGQSVENGTTSSVGFASVGSTVPCDDKTKYKVICLDNAGTTGGAESQELLANSPTLNFDLKTKALSYYQVKVKDYNTDAWQTVVPDVASGSNSTTSFQDMNITRVYGSTGAAIAAAAGASEDFLIQFKTATAYKYAGSPDQSCYVTVDVGSAKPWEDVTVAVGGAVLPTAQKSDMGNDADMYSYISDADYVFLAGKGEDFGNSFKEFELQYNTRGTSDPAATTGDVTFCLFCAGRYKSSDAADTFNIGVVTDASTQLRVATDAAYTPCLTIKHS